MRNSFLIVLAFGMSAMTPPSAAAQERSLPALAGAGPVVAGTPPQGTGALLPRVARPQAPDEPLPPGQSPPPRQPVPPPPPPAPPSPKRLINIQVELTITDQSGANSPVKKTVTMIAADSTWGRIRASAMARPNERTGNVPLELNVDVRPMVLSNDGIQIEMTVEYRPLSTVMSGEPSQVSPTSLNQSLSVILQNGKPLVVSQAADPVTDRKIVVEVKATVLK